MAFLEHLLVFTVYYISVDAIAQPLDAQTFAADYTRCIRLFSCATCKIEIITPVSSTMRLIVAVRPNVDVTFSSMLNLSPVLYFDNGHILYY
jgi:hypothetical protein